MGWGGSLKIQTGLWKGVERMKRAALLGLLVLALATVSLAYPDPGNTSSCSSTWTTYGFWQAVYSSSGSLTGYRRHVVSYEEYASGSGTCSTRVVDSWWEYR